AVRHRHGPGDEVWLILERRSNGETKYHLSNYPPSTLLETLVAALKARWSCEQAHQQMKEELGLDHFEGRSWTGLHHHALLTMIAFAFLQTIRCEEKKRPSSTGSLAAIDPADDSQRDDACRPLSEVRGFR